MGGRAIPGDTGNGQGNTANTVTSIGGGNLPARPTFGAKSVGAAAVPPGTPMVNSGSTVGWYQTPDSFMYSGGRVTPSRVNSNAPQLVPITQMEPLISKWAFSLNPADKAKYDSVVGLMRRANYFDTDNPAFSTVQSAWNQVLTGASYNTQFSPIEYLELMAQKGQNPATGPAGSGTGTQTSTSTDTRTSTNVSLSNKFDALAVLNDALSNYLGRQASDQELKAFKSILNAQERKNPEKSTTTTTQTATSTSSGTNTTSSSATSSDGVSSGGVNEGQIAKEYAQSRGDYAETQMATVGMEWFQDAIRAMGSGRMI